MRAGRIAIAAGAAWCAPALAPHVARLCGPLRISRTLPIGSRDVALTFDDGPHPQGTPAVLEALAAHGATATFFLVGEQVERYPSLAADVAAAGHGIALHGYRHRTLLRIPPAVLRDDLHRAHALIAEVTGHAPTVYRPPYGVFSPAGLRIARREGWEPMLWSKWGTDWRKFIRPETIARRVTTGMVAGDVLLLHDADHYSARDSHLRTAAALPLILEQLRRRGLRSVAL
jgi:peptidoglycan/xylan/chitin deacetylase (PgdA/CDA1 family)